MQGFSLVEKLEMLGIKCIFFFFFNENRQSSFLFFSVTSQYGSQFVRTFFFRFIIMRVYIRLSLYQNN